MGIEGRAGSVDDRIELPKLQRCRAEVLKGCLKGFLVQDEQHAAPVSTGPAADACCSVPHACAHVGTAPHGVAMAQRVQAVAAGAQDGRHAAVGALKMGERCCGIVVDEQECGLTRRQRGRGRRDGLQRGSS